MTEIEKTRSSHETDATRSFTVTAIIAAYNEEDIIAQTVGDLIRQGIYVYFIDNCSTDATVERINPFLETGLLEIEQYPAGADSENRDCFPWEALLHRKEELAMTLDSDWFIHQDADEFRESPWEHLNLLEGIKAVDRMGYNAIDFEIFEFQPTRHELLPHEDIRPAFPYYDHTEWFNKLRINCWKKTIEPVRLSASGGHQAEFQNRKIFPVRFILRHYPIRGQLHGERKVFKDRFPRFLKSEQEKNWHIQYNDIQKSHCFIRDPSELIFYDAFKVRTDLFLKNRESEILQQAVDQLNRDVRSLRQSTEERALNISRLQQANQLLSSEMTALCAQTQSVERRMASEEAKSNHLLQALEAARQEVREIRLSWSWRITKPLRKAYDFFGFHKRRFKPQNEQEK